MAGARAWSILACEMVVDTFTKRHSFICCLRRRCAIDRLGLGRYLPTPSPSITPNAALPSPLLESRDG